VGTVYLEFRSKDALLEEIASSHHGSILTRMRAAVDDAEPTPTARLRAAFDARLDALLAVQGKGGHARDLVRCTCPAVEDAWRRFVDNEAAMLRDILAKGVAAG